MGICVFAIGSVFLMQSIDFVCEIEKEWKRTLNGKMVASVCRRIWTILVEKY